MLVKAVFSNGKYGFYGSSRRYDGDKFEIDPKHFSKVWMVNVEAKKTRKSEAKIELTSNLEQGV